MVKHLSFGAVVVGLDGREPDGAALAWALGEAVRRDRPLYLIATHDTLRAAACRIAEMSLTLEVRTTGVQDGLVPLILRASATADSVVVPSGGTGRLRSAVVGSTAVQVASHASCPVVVVRSGVTVSPGAVVVGVDGSPLSAEAVGYAYHQAAERGVSLTVVHAWHADPIEERIGYAASDGFLSERADAERVFTAECVAGWADKYPDVVARLQVVRGTAVDALVTESQSASLVVVGSRGWGDLRGTLLGSVSQGCIRRAHSPVVVVRPRTAQLVS